MSTTKRKPKRSNKMKFLNPDGPPGITPHTFFVNDTTLLQPIPFGDMDKDHHESIKGLIARFEDEKDQPGYQQLIQMYKLTGTGFNRPNIQAGRGVFQVASVSISHNTDPCYDEIEIYGSISLTSDNGDKSYTIYERKPDDPEAVSPPDCEELSLSKCPVAPLMKGKVVFDLSTKNGLHFKASRDVDWAFKPNCDDEDELPVDFGNGYYAMLIYSIIPYALIGKIGTNLYGPPKSEHTKETIYIDGDIEVQHISFLKSNKFVLKRSDKSETVYHWEQSRSVIATAAYAWIRAEFSLKIDGIDFATGKVGTSPTVNMTNWMSHRCEDEDYSFSIYVEWIRPDEYFSLLPKIQLPGSVQLVYPLVNDGKDDVDVKCSPTVAPEIDQPPTTVTSDCSLLDDTIVKCTPDVPPQVYQSPAEVKSSNYYVEVFSVFVGCRDSTLHALSGTILVRDREDTVYIYSRKTGYPDKLFSAKKFRALSLTWPGDRWVLDEDFYMHFKINDGSGNDVCWGNLSWSDSDFPINLQRFDRRICDVIPGEKAGLYFAAVHYSIFRNAQRAKVTVSVQCKGVPCSFLDVCGSIYAEYNNHDYSSAFDKEFHRIIILDRTWEYRAQVQNNCSEVPLSKSLITAPSDCQELIITFDLKVCPYKPADSIYYDHLVARGPLRFTATKHDSIQIQRLPIMGEKYTRPPGFFTVKVEWFDDSHDSRVVGDDRWSRVLN